MITEGCYDVFAISHHYIEQHKLVLISGFTTYNSPQIILFVQVGKDGVRFTRTAEVRPAIEYYEASAYHLYLKLCLGFEKNAKKTVEIRFVCGTNINNPSQFTNSTEPNKYQVLVGFGITENCPENGNRRLQISEEREGMKYFISLNAKARDKLLEYPEPFGTAVQQLADVEFVVTRCAISY